MFDFRYHALTLAAVFLSLMVGLLLGIAIGDKGLVSSAENKVRASLRHDVRAAQHRSDALRAELGQRDRFEADLHALLVDGRLAGQRVALIGLGGLPDPTIRHVRDALRDTGGRLAAVAVVREPPPDPLPSVGRGKRRRTPANTTAGVRRLGIALGADVIRGGSLLGQVQRSVLQSSSGKLGGVDAVVLVRSPGQLEGAEQARSAAWEEGLVAGLSAGSAPVVGVESVKSSPSQIGWFKDRDLPSVDDVDQLAGQVALVFTLGGANGAYGVKDTATALLPKTAGGR